MKCPVDDAVLVMSERSGIEIDYCPTCRGVWLDRGELDKIVERSLAPTVEQGPAVSTQNQAPPMQQYPTQNPFQGRSDHNSGGHGSGGYDQYGRKRKKESWLSELFD